MAGRRRCVHREVVLAGLIAGGAFVALMVDEHLEERAYHAVPMTRLAPGSGGRATPVSSAVTPRPIPHLAVASVDR